MFKRPWAVSEKFLKRKWTWHYHERFKRSVWLENETNRQADLRWGWRSSWGSSFTRHLFAGKILDCLLMIAGLLNSFKLGRGMRSTCIFKKELKSEYHVENGLELVHLQHCVLHKSKFGDTKVDGFETHFRRRNNRNLLDWGESGHLSRQSLKAGHLSRHILEEDTTGIY